MIQRQTARPYNGGMKPRLHPQLPYVLLIAAAFHSITQGIAGDLPDLTELYRLLHSRPELSGQEEQTAGIVAAELRRVGFDVTEGVGRFSDSTQKCHGVVGVMRNGRGPVVMLRTDLDALPVEERTGLAFASQVKAKGPAGEVVSVMHACGHDLHMTVFLGAARELSRNRSQWTGTLVMVGQPAEETGAGAQAMLNDGLYSRFPKPDYALALHASADLEAGRIEYCPGYAMAGVDSVDVTIRGRGGHGASPHRTKDPIVLAAQFVMALQTIVSREVSPLDSAVVTVGSIHGGTKHNIIPDEVKLQLTVRSYKPEVRERILTSIDRMAKGVALTGGVGDAAAPSVSYGKEHQPPLFNSPALAERLASVWRRELGESQVSLADPVMFAEDFAYFSRDGVAGCLFWLGAVPKEAWERHKADSAPLPALHSRSWTPDVERAIPTGIRALVSAALELFRGAAGSGISEDQRGPSSLSPSPGRGNVSVPRW